MTLADHIVIMKGGTIQQVGTPADVYHKPANTFVAQFIGAPSMNMLPARTNGQGVKLASGASLALGGVSGPARDVIVGIRPDDLHPVAEAPLVEGRVSLREPLGHETLIYVDLGDTEVIAKADGRAPPPVGETVRLGARAEHVHVFDAETGAALR
jgi:multiple sugar transport system ATP-binding protein